MQLGGLGFSKKRPKIQQEETKRHCMAKRDVRYTYDESNIEQYCEDSKVERQQYSLDGEQIPESNP